MALRGCAQTGGGSTWRWGAPRCAWTCPSLPQKQQWVGLKALPEAPNTSSCKPNITYRVGNLLLSARYSLPPTEAAVGGAQGAAGGAQARHGPALGAGRAGAAGGRRRPQPAPLPGAGLGTRRRRRGEEARSAGIGGGRGGEGGWRGPQLAPRPGAGLGTRRRRRGKEAGSAGVGRGGGGEGWGGLGAGDHGLLLLQVPAGGHQGCSGALCAPGGQRAPALLALVLFPVLVCVGGGDWEGERRKGGAQRRRRRR